MSHELWALEGKKADDLPALGCCGFGSDELIAPVNLLILVERKLQAHAPNKSDRNRQKVANVVDGEHMLRMSRNNM